MTSADLLVYYNQVYAHKLNMEYFLLGSFVDQSKILCNVKLCYVDQNREQNKGVLKKYDKNSTLFS